MGKEQFIRAIGRALVDRVISPDESGLDEEEQEFLRRENIKNALREYADQLDIVYRRRNGQIAKAH